LNSFQYSQSLYAKNAVFVIIGLLVSTSRRQK
jgi:hypothetical protein